MSKKETKKDYCVPILRYVIVFLIIIVTIFAFTVSSCLIPHDWIKDNTIKSIEETATEIRNSRKDQKPYRRFETYGDIRNYAMIFYTDNSNPVRSAIEMNYAAKCKDSTLCANVLTNSNENTRLESYARYWQGQSVALHFLTIFGSFLSVRTFLTILFVLLLIFVTYKLFKEDKILAIALNISLISVNIAFVTRSLEYLPVFFVMLGAILLILKSRKNKYKNLDLIFLILGVLTCYFDFLTCETITLTIPLIIFMYLEIKAKKKIEKKTILKLIILWGIGYAGAFVAKWLISYLFMGQAAFDAIFNNMFGHKLNISLLERVTAPILLSFSKLLPFALIGKYGGYLALGCFLACLIYAIKKNKKYLPLFVVCLIPLLRFIVVNAHSLQLNYFTYRAFLCVAMVMCITILQVISKRLKKN